MTDTTAAPAVKAPPGEGDLAITELVEFDPTRLDGVKSGATGIGFLLMKAAAGTSAPDAEPAEVTEPDWLPAAKALLAAALADPKADPAELLKAVNAAGEIDEGPDIAGGRQAIQLIARLIIGEAQELEAGEFGEVCDIEMLCQAVDCLRCWLGMEGAPGGGDAMKGCGCCPDCVAAAGKAAGDMTITCPPGGVTFSSGTDSGSGGTSSTLLVAENRDSETGFWQYGPLGVAKDSRTFSAAERKQHAKEGNALPDGSYPIPDKDALRRAAILARSKHGDWKAAERLIARRARELGVPNPLTEHDDEKAGKSVADVAQDATGRQDVHQDGGLSKAVEAAVTKALEGPKAEIATLRAELAKVADLPRPGGPVMAVVRPSQGAGDGIDWLTKAAEAQKLADTLTDSGQAAKYRQLASQWRAKAEALG